MPADERLIIIFIPENRVENTGLDACAAAGASLGLQEHTTALTDHKSVLRACTGAGRVHACPAGGQHKTMLHAPGGFNSYAGLCKTDILVNARACEHAALAAYALVRVQNLKSHLISPVTILTLLKEYPKER
jgi:hypothetical protein